MVPVTTKLPSMMTAANLGAHVIGWRFVVSTIGSIGSWLVRLAAGRTNLVATNALLKLANAVGIWRWPGRQRAYEDGGASAKTASPRSSAATLFTATGLGGMPVVDSAGEPVGNSLAALTACDRAEIAYVVVASGGLGGTDEGLCDIARVDLRCECDRLVLALPADAFASLTPLAAGEWPAEAPARKTAA